MQQLDESLSDEKLEAALTLMENEQDAFMSHWVWKKIGLPPEKFFAAFREYLDSLNLPQKQWETTLQRVRDASRIYSKEKQMKPSPINGKILPGLKA